MNKSKKSISQIRIEKEKAEFVEQLKRTPVIQVVCEKLGIGRATFYRWKSDDKEFSEAVDLALTEGRLLVNDLAESQLVTAIKERNMQAITYWLRHHHRDYKTKVELSGTINTIHELSPEQEQIVQEALKLAGISEYGKEFNPIDN
jgi:hypothetical protein